MVRAQTLVQLSSELVARLDLEAARRGCSRSALIRTAVVAHLAEVDEAERVHRYVEGYRLRPQDDVDDWGDLDAQLDDLATEQARLLDAEERAAGATW